MQLGIRTDTMDMTGTVLSESPVETDEEAIRSVFGKFTGTFQQVPPVFSALKHQGVPLYKLARSGKPVQKPARTVTIHELSIRSVDLPFIRFYTLCSGGTYIRSLADDIGKELGCGAVLKELERSRNGPFFLKDAHRLEALAELPVAQREEAVVPMADTLPHIREYAADIRVRDRIRHGQPLIRSDLGIVGDGPAGSGDPYLKVVDRDGNLLAILMTRPYGVGLDYISVFI